MLWLSGVVVDGAFISGGVDVLSAHPPLSASTKVARPWADNTWNMVLWGVKHPLWGKLALLFA